MIYSSLRDASRGEKFPSNYLHGCHSNKKKKKKGVELKAWDGLLQKMVCVGKSSPGGYPSAQWETPMRKAQAHPIPWMEIIAFVRLRLSALRPAGSGRAVERRAGEAKRRKVGKILMASSLLLRAFFKRGN
jgi:hypothetical protein